MLKNDLSNPESITGHLRLVYRSRILTAAVSHLKVFELFAKGPVSPADIQKRLKLKDRPFQVLLPSLRAMGLLMLDVSGNILPTKLGESLLPANTPNLISYVSLEAQDPGVLEMVDRLFHDGPTQQTGGTAYVKEAEGPSPMDNPETARLLTLALSGRARYLSPIVAAKIPKSNGHLLDVAGGTGLFAYEWLLANPKASATVLDTENVLKVSKEILEEFCTAKGECAKGLKDRVILMPGDMFTSTLPKSDIILAASVLHDWPDEMCITLTKKFAAALNPGGELWLHNSFLNDEKDGPLSVTDYSAALFWITKGRCYSRKEYYAFMLAANLKPSSISMNTMMGYGLISGSR